MTTQTLLRLRELKLGGMAGALEQQLQQTDTFEALPFVERLSLLLEQEYSLRENRKQLRLIRQARFRVSATVQEIDYQHKRNLKREVVARLAQGDWIDRKQNLLITGACGYGKNLHCLCDWTRRLPARILCSLLSDFTAAARAHTDQS